uniref:Uncharacterized protein n=1 Tax=Pseudo-nitzschia australis TaxID=44445 RepID=A0A7S4AF09_9STRA|mmetsp:Transcript_10637/g.22720  ORF Transcript_10637/g.22720 Transcript_10637/m.22720 type:complete len:236 (-) Transcript_10637:10-717(-)|eukprot:CAMPEP_0168164934 /NCGR_PEP_ID=MMETSP0139_2-20121125/1209_1 /TAXON_ID=44445 /ORGANISM="Pseudo-nitzschia australis, Strain 10249 10 AB" /LENGTH=235 /DNA_ID=CAMNT_0008081999 /DNA_START=55 /DNA_END=762 /DNA_ORIENTATION=+
MNTYDWITVTAKKQLPTPSIVTPMVNRYQGLDDDATSVHSNASEAYTEASAYTVDSVMSEPDYKAQSKSVKELIAKEDLKPITDNVTSIDVDTFQEVVAQALAKIKSRYTSEVSIYGGYSFLVESELGYQLRCRNPDATLPDPQLFPKRPKQETPTKLKPYYKHLDSYEIEHDCNVAVCELVDMKFPVLLNDLKQSGIQSFDGVFTAREAFDHLDAEVGSVTAANDKFATQLQEL